MHNCVSSDSDNNDTDDDDNDDDNNDDDREHEIYLVASTQC